MITTNDFKTGITIQSDGNLWLVIEFQHVKPGKGPAFVRTKMRQIESGKVLDFTFSAGHKIEIVRGWARISTIRAKHITASLAGCTRVSGGNPKRE